MLFLQMFQFFSTEAWPRSLILVYIVPRIFFGDYPIGLSFPTRLAAEVMFALFFAFQSFSFLLYITLYLSFLLHAFVWVVQPRD